MLRYRPKNAAYLFVTQLSLDISVVITHWPCVFYHLQSTRLYANAVFDL